MVARKNSSAQLSGRRSVDFDLYKIVRLRLLDAPEQTIGALAKWLGSPLPATDRHADISIRFSAQLTRAKLTYLGLNAAAFNDQGFYILGWKSGRIAARIPFEKIGQQCEILCHDDVRSVPLLVDIINLCLLDKGYVSLHASAFVYNELGVVVAGWEKGGKTETLLAFANHGAHYVGDECITLAGDGSKMFGLALPVTLWQWQFKQIPTLLPPISIKRQLLFKAIHFVELVYRWAGRARCQKAFPFYLLGNHLPALRKQLKLTAPPSHIFQERVIKQAVKPEVLLLVMSHSAPEISIEPCDPAEVAARMTQSNMFEYIPIHGYYKAYKFAFPDHPNELLDTLETQQQRLLNQALAKIPAYKISHPYPLSLEDLFKAVEPVLDAIRTRSSSAPGSTGQPASSPPLPQAIELASNHRKGHLCFPSP